MQGGVLPAVPLASLALGAERLAVAPAVREAVLERLLAAAAQRAPVHHVAKLVLSSRRHVAAIFRAAAAGAAHDAAGEVAVVEGATVRLGVLVALAANLVLVVRGTAIRIHTAPSDAFGRSPALRGLGRALVVP